VKTALTTQKAEVPAAVFQAYLEKLPETPAGRQIDLIVVEGKLGRRANLL
jgi:hypothetical protein